MKTAHFICTIATTLFTTFSAVSADQPSDRLALRFAAVADVYDAVRQTLGRDAAAAVVFVDMRTNTLKLDASHRDAAKVRELINKLDARPATVKVAATIKRVIPATPTAAAREVVLSRPTVIAAAGQPMTLNFDDGAGGTINVELIVTTDPK